MVKLYLRKGAVLDDQGAGYGTRECEGHGDADYCDCRHARVESCVYQSRMNVIPNTTAIRQTSLGAFANIIQGSLASQPFHV